MLFVLGGMMLAGLTACSSDDDTKSTKETEKTPVENEVKVRRLTITEVEGDAADAKQALTRATLEEDESGLVPSWEAGDELTYCNLSRMQYNGEEEEEEEDVPVSGNLTATTTAATSQFTGNVTCSAGDYLAVVYPATTTFTASDNTFSYTLPLTGQDGTLAGLATRFHYVYGKALVNSVTDATADATMPKMKSLLTVCKFSFVDKATNEAIPIKSLSISYGGTGGDAGTYPQTATVAIGANTAQDDVHATGEASNSPLLLEGSGEAFYVALLPTAAQRTFRFTVTDDSGSTYTGTAKATLTEGEYVEATGLRLTKQ